MATAPASASPSPALPLGAAFRLSLNALFMALRVQPACWKDSAPWLAGLCVVSALMNQYFQTLMGLSPPGSNAALVSQLGLVGWDLTESLFIALLIPFRMRERADGATVRASVKSLLVRYTGPLTIESIRVLAEILIWALALILPGLYKMARLTFVPFVVLFDSEYRAGKRDALRRSEALSQGILLPLILISALFLAADLGLGTFQNSYSLFEQPAVIIAVSVCSVSLSVFFYSWLTALYSELARLRP